MTEDHPRNWSPGRRIHYKMSRLGTPTLGTWVDEPDKIAFEAVADAHPDTVPSVEEIIERDLDIGVTWTISDESET